MSSSFGAEPKQELDSSDFLQVIDFDGDFVNEERILSFLHNSGIDGKKGDDYGVCAIMGPQSSGKSTLLNLLFGTRFTVMDASKGRSQTTKGVWMAKAVDDDLLVMDLEGNDSRERGDERNAFERQIALFALALSKVLCVNLWAHDMGRYNAANYGLLKTVFEVNLELFATEAAHGASNKSLLVFIIRDHTADTPVSSIEAMILSDIERIWSEINKPAQFATSKAADFFDFSFKALPHKTLQAPQFAAEIDVLRKWFCDEADANYVFATHKEDVPGDGLGKFAQDIWAAIKSNKDLDLPTQREMLAIYRCDEIKDTVKATALERIGVLVREAEDDDEGLVNDLGAALDSICEMAVNEYNEVASRYQKEIWQRKQDQLVADVVAAATPLFTRQLATLRKVCVAHFSRALGALLRGSGGKAKKRQDFATSVAQARGEALARFDDVAGASIMKGSGWSLDEARAEVVAAVEKHARTARKELFDKFAAASKDALVKSAWEAVSEVIDSADASLWTRVQSALNDARDAHHARVLDGVQGFALSDTKQAVFLHCWERAARGALVTKLRESTRFLAQRVKDRFDSAFRYDEDAVPRVWAPTDNVHKLFTASRDDALQLIDWFGVAELGALKFAFPADDASASDAEAQADFDDEADESGAVELLDAEARRMLRKKMERELQGAFTEAKAAQDALSTNTKVPGWALGAMLLLGWDEMWSVLTNPMLFLFVLLLAVGYFLLYRAGLGDLPIIVAKQVGGMVMSKVAEVQRGATAGRKTKVA